MTAISEACSSVLEGAVKDCNGSKRSDFDDFIRQCQEPQVWAITASPDGLLVVDRVTGKILDQASRALRESFGKIIRAKDYAAALADGFAGQAVHLEWVNGLPALVTADGQQVHAGPGQGIPFRLAAMAAMEAETAFLALGQTVDGRHFGISASGWASSLRFSLAHQQKRSTTSRKTLRASVLCLTNRLAAMEYDQSFSLCGGGRVKPVSLVLTCPTLDPAIVPNVTEAGEERRVLAAFELFRKREIFRDHVFGGMRGYEITRRLCGDGVILFHPHIHSLLWAQFLPQQRWAVHWWTCIRTATLAEYGFDIDNLYRNPEAHILAVSACVYVQQVRNRVAKKYQTFNCDGHPDQISLESAIQESVKYMAKPQDVAAYIPGPHGEKIRVGLPSHHLVKEAMRRSPRVFATLGAARTKWDLPSWCKWQDHIADHEREALLGIAGKGLRGTQGSKCSLETSSISDGDLKVGVEKINSKNGMKSLRKLMESLDLDDWLCVLAQRAQRANSHFRKGLKSKGYMFPEIAD